MDAGTEDFRAIRRAIVLLTLKLWPDLGGLFDEEGYDGHDDD